MVKGRIEWDYEPKEGLTVRINPGLAELLDVEKAAEARKQVLVAIRNLIDVAVKRMDETEGASGKKATKIKVE